MKTISDVVEASKPTALSVKSLEDAVAEIAATAGPKKPDAGEADVGPRIPVEDRGEQFVSRAA